jgi:hypothetical protein
MTCSICIQPIGSNKVTTECGHSFHPICILKWISRQNNCPNCRYECPIDLDDIPTITYPKREIIEKLRTLLKEIDDYSKYNIPLAINTAKIFFDFFGENKQIFEEYPSLKNIVKNKLVELDNDENWVHSHHYSLKLFNESLQ